tara:strand:+ start:763 stop:1140 length:378 start_codon:yes stop_codon:yes gene_type:complete
MLFALLTLAALTNCSVTDGDTIRCGSERIPLLGIDAPEPPGHCRKGRHCAPGDPVRSRALLKKALRNGPLTITRVGKDRYGRTLATMRAGTVDLSCWQLAHRAAIYRADWDNGGHIAARCPRLTR